MTALDHGKIRTAMATQLAAVVLPSSNANLRASRTPVRQVNCPQASVQDSQGEFDGAMGRGLDQAFRYRVRVFAAPVENMDRGSDILDVLMKPDGPTSLRAALASDTTFGGGCQTSRVESYQSHVIYDVAGQQYIGAELVILVW